VHFRQVGEAEVPVLRDVVYDVVGGAKSFLVSAGRKVLNIIPRTEWHKGTAAQWINEHLFSDDEVLSVYFGDDATDEDAFGTLTNAVTVKVGGCPATRAKYRVPGPPAVHEFLEWLTTFDPAAQEQADAFHLQST
jgi:trehalose-phosphatase